MIRRSFWGISDQAVNSLSSLVLAVMVARSSSPAEVGAWAIAYAIYTFVLSVARSAINTTALIKARPAGETGLTVEDRGSVSLALCVGTAVGILMVLAGIIVSGPVGAFVLIFGIGAPVLLLQDSVRYVLIRQRRPHLTSVIDVVWITIQIGAGLILQSTIGGGEWVTVGWILGAAVSSVVGIVIIGNAVSVKDAKKFVRSNLRAGSKLLVEAMLSAGATNLNPVLISAVLGLAATGYFRGSLTLLGVAGILVMGLTPIATVELLSKVRSIKSISIFLFAWTLFLACVGIALLILLINLPDSAGVELLGETWFGTQEILFAMSLQVIFRGPVTGVPIILRAAHELNSAVALRLAHSVVSLGVTFAGTLLFGLQGAAWGWALSSVVGGLVALGFYFRYVRSIQRGRI